MCSSDPAAPAAPAVAAPAAAPKGETRDCDCCFDSVPLDGGLTCPGKGHFFCDACLANFLNAFKTAEYAEQKKGKGRALCPMKDSESPFGDGALVAHVPQETFDEYLQIRIKVAEKGIQEQFEKENADKIAELKEKLAKAEGTGEQMELDKHRLKIIDDIFTLKCPRCHLAFLDYDNCSAITCAGCKCGFCSYCLEDCGADAHQHFYKNKSKCPVEGGPLFIDHAKWQGYQARRKERLLCDYLATIPLNLRQKVVDLCAPDAKDLGIKMPEDCSDKGLDPDLNVRLKLSVPRKLRAKLGEEAKSVDLGGVKLTLPGPKDKVKVSSSAGDTHVIARKEPKLVVVPKGIAARLPEDTEVTVDDEWLECNCKKDKIGHGWVKSKHISGRIEHGGKAVIKDAGGYGSVLIRKRATQEEGKNTAGFVDDGTEVNVVKSWVECEWADPLGVFPAKRGFLEACDVPEDDVVLQGEKAACWDVVAKLEKAIGFGLMARQVGGKGGAAAAAAAGFKGKGKGKKGKKGYY